MAPSPNPDSEAAWTLLSYDMYILSYNVYLLIHLNLILFFIPNIDFVDERGYCVANILPVCKYFAQLVFHFHV